MRTTVSAAIALTLAAGATPAFAADGPSAKGGPSSTSGIWRMDGYGTVLDLRDGELREYQTTAVSCLTGFTGRETRPGVYTTPDNVVLRVRTLPRRDRASLGIDGSVGHRNLQRIPALPDACTRPAAEGPLATFDVFWSSFAENYPFFAAKGIDWDGVRAHYRPKVHADTTREELFTVFRDMVAPLYDAHVSVGDIEHYFAHGRPGTVLPTEEFDAEVKKHIVRRDLKNARGVRDFGNGRITYADLPGERGYLRISGFGGYADEGAPYSAERAELDKALDAILTEERVERLKGLVIDLRVNGGGSDALGIRVAERLTDASYVAYTKRARNDPADPAKYTRPEPIRVSPAEAPRYTGPVAVLTGGSTVSAGETLTQALIDRPGRVVRIGEPTQGVFSDIMGRVLPNGMGAVLPNEQYLTRTGDTFDGPGIPPHLKEPVFTEEEFAKERDSAFDRALNVLR
ncbi:MULTISPECIES: S41 family peptidase [unclassified Streptomyces]|uniref:S41 family peptidase n=1 Tax=unclassified Streptomyces TaxID=2593676 RepID=UPI0007497E73|nr:MULTISPECIES: S41 family peptidase [unclassified Streptomyces]KUL53022.1 protease [Streptomyces sp. NRRL S-1521]